MTDPLIACEPLSLRDGGAPPVTERDDRRSTRPLRVLHVVTLVSPAGAFGGPLRVALNQAAELRRRGHDVEIIAAWEGRGSRPTAVAGEDVNLFPSARVPGAPGFAGLCSPSMLRWLHSHASEFDVAHVHAARDLITLPAIGLIKRAGVPYVCQTHGMVVPDSRRVVDVIDRIATRPLMRRASSCLTLTDREEGELSTVLGSDISTERIINGLRVEDRPTSERSAIPEVLFCARLDERKRPMDFVEMAGLLVARGVDAQFTLAGPDEGELTKVRAEIRSRNLSNQVHYDGPLAYDEVLDRMARAAVYVLPSIDEPFPMSLLEAMSIGMACVCTTGCGIADLLREDESALVVPPNPEALADVVQVLLGDDAKCRSLGERAKAAARMRFSMDTVGDTLERSYCAATSAERLRHS